MFIYRTFKLFLIFKKVAAIFLSITNHYISLGVEKTNSHIFNEKERNNVFQSLSFDEVLKNKKYSKEKGVKSVSYKRTYKVYPSSLFKACKSNIEFQKFHFFISLHSLTRNKCIHNYKSKIIWIANQCGISERKCRENINLLKKDGWIWNDFNPKHLRIKAKTHMLHHFETYDPSNAIPNWGIKCITIEYNKFITLNQLKTLALELKQDQKTYAELNRVFRIGEIEKSKIKLTNISRDILKKYCLTNLANFKTTSILYLQDIQKLFEYADKSTSSRLIAKLQKENCLTIQHQFKRKREVKSFFDEIDSRFEKGCMKVNDIIFQQMANRLHFNLPFVYKKNKFVEFMNVCTKEYFKKVLSYKHIYMNETKEMIDTKRYKGMMKKNGIVKRHVKEEFYNSSDILCGINTFIEVKHYNNLHKLEKTQRINNKVNFFGDCTNGYMIQWERENEMDEWGIKLKKGKKVIDGIEVGRIKRSLSKSKLGGFYFMYSKNKLKTDEMSIQFILSTMDMMWSNPMRDMNGRTINSEQLNMCLSG